MILTIQMSELIFQSGDSTDSYGEDTCLQHFPNVHNISCRLNVAPDSRELSRSWSVKCCCSRKSRLKSLLEGSWRWQDGDGVLNCPPPPKEGLEGKLFICEAGGCRPPMLCCICRFTDIWNKHSQHQGRRGAKQRCLPPNAISLSLYCGHFINQTHYFVHY